MAKDLFEKVRWGKEAATAGIIYGMTYILSKAMLLLLPENKTLSGPMAMIHNKVAIAEIVVGIFFVAIICKLFLAGNWMKNNMKLWWQYYNRYENKDSGFTEDFEGTIENLRVLGTSRTAGLLKLWVPVIVWMAVIFFFSGIPDLRSGLKYDFILRKIVHIIEYFILTLLLYRAFKDSLKLDIQRLFVYPFGLSYLYAVSDEVHQSFVPGRTCTVRDLLIDVVGMIGFYLALRALAKRACAKNAQIG
jgi:VanZ family protein